MRSDLQALLAAVVADPSDDVARLVYADCLEEHGNAARAAFVRLQIDAERHHPDSNTRAALDSQARMLFERHWQEWGGEVCDAFGLAPDVLRCDAERRSGPLDLHFTDERAYGVRLDFRRGFPGAVSFTPAGADFVRECLSRLSVVSPLDALTALDGGDGWPDGPYLADLRALALLEYDVGLFQNVVRSPHLLRLKSLKLRPSYRGGFAADLAAVFRSPWAARLRSLDVPLQSEEAGAALLSASTPQLETLRLDLPWLNEDDDDFDQPRWLSELARTPHLAGLQRLEVAAQISPNDMVPLTQHPVWTGLRRLDLGCLPDEQFGALVATSTLSELDELRLAWVNLTTGAVADLVRSPLLKRVKHLTLRGGYQDGRALLPLVDVVDPARIETFAIQAPYFPERAANALRAKFGDRVRFLPV